MGLLRVIKGTYQNQNAVKYLIRYITRTRYNEDRANELIGFGSLGTGESSERMIQDFLAVQKCLRASSKIGKRIHHEVFLLKIEEAKQLAFPASTQYLQQAAWECAQYYYTKGFQVVFAIHADNDKGVHFHFAVNSVNYKNGNKWSSSLRDLKEREELFIRTIEKYCQITSGYYYMPPIMIQPVIFYDRRHNHGLQNASYYVSIGDETEGIFDSWEKCELQREKDFGVYYRKFPSLDSAVCYVENEINPGKKYVINLADTELFFGDYNAFIDCLRNMAEVIKKYVK